MAQNVAVSQRQTVGWPTRIAQLIPGIVLLFVLGYLGKLVQQGIKQFGTANHVALPDLEYVLWAIIFGLIIANTVELPKIFDAGVRTYDFWLKTGIVLLDARFLLGDVLALGGVFSTRPITSLGNLSRWAFPLCFAGVGLRTDLREIKRQGARPFIVGALAELSITIVTLGLVLGAAALFNL